ncbi:M20 family metallo-hydrolase [Pseudoruegeria sp. HB172150]|uniref:M20 family metallo-hydrolase n=1 Tax=Pseudoruegeria sp. HB172150 TaxID=2721164 RepID=UPI001556F2EF|nr:M20 family metallo-hydrolase [Pseudoruegeria sp. HB172150]
MTDWGTLAEQRLRDLSAISEPGPGVTRRPFTAEHRAAIDYLSDWMRQVGLTVTLDDAGTLVGRLDGPDGTGTLYTGSHQDSVREGGAYDGIMGVALPILALEKLREDGVHLPFAVEVLAFADEEGIRFPTALIGPRALAGTFDARVLDLKDNTGVTLRTALERFGLQPDNIPTLARAPETAIGFLETHIEQGPVLEAENEALGVVSTICGIERHQVTVYGRTGHAGTLPMQGRKDALVAAATLVTALNRLASETVDLRATVGELHVEPNVVNAVPREVRLTAEIRSPDDTVRESAGHALHRIVSKVAETLGLPIDVTRTYFQIAEPCDPEMIKTLCDSVREAGGRGPVLPSGATHDASAMAALCPIAMLFVRCREGVSHDPSEHASAADMGQAVEAIADFLARRSARAGP